jgi:hypothetical protein
LQMPELSQSLPKKRRGYPEALVGGPDVVNGH